MGVIFGVLAERHNTPRGPTMRTTTKTQNIIHTAIIVGGTAAAMWIGSKTGAIEPMWDVVRGAFAFIQG